MRQSTRLKLNVPADVVDVNLWMVTQSALVGSAAVVVLDAIRVEDLNLPVVQLHEERIRDISTGTIRGMTHEVMRACMPTWRSMGTTGKFVYRYHKNSGKFTNCCCYITSAASQRDKNRKLYSPS